MTNITLYKDGETRLIATNGRKVIGIQRVNGELMRDFGLWTGDFKSYVTYRASQGMPKLRELYFGFATQVPRTCESMRKFIEDRKLL